MARAQAVPIVLTDFERNKLTENEHSRTLSYALVQRSKIILLAASELPNTRIVQQLGVNKKMVVKWRKRWLEYHDRLQEMQTTDTKEKDILSYIDTVVLADRHRPGAPRVFTDEQRMRIKALACEAPTASGRELGQWSLPALADEAVQRGIVETVSPASVSRFLKIWTYPAS